MKRQQQYVPAVLPGVAANSVQVTAPRKELDDVTVQIAQNAAGGVGVAGLAGLASWQLSGGDWQTVAVAALVAGFAVFCAALAIRSFADEGAILVRVVRKEIELRTMLEDVEAEWAAQLEDAEAALSDALVEIAELQALSASLRRERDIALAEAQQLRAQLNPTYRPAVSLYDSVRRDAKSLIKLAFDAGEWIGRDRADLQWGKERWRQAQELLQDAGVIQLRGKQVRILLADLASAVAAIDAYTLAIAPSDEA